MFKGFSLKPLFKTSSVKLNTSFKPLDTHQSILQKIPSSNKTIRLNSDYLNKKVTWINPDTRQNLKWIGYEEKQINDFTEKQIQLFQKYSLNKTNKLLLKHLFLAYNYPEQEIEQHVIGVARAMLNYGVMNETDDGYGMRPMWEDELMEMIIQRIKPFKSPNSDKPSSLPEKTEEKIEEKTESSSTKASELTGIARQFVESGYTLINKDENNLAEKMTSSAHKVCEALGVESLSEELKIVENPDSRRNEISQETFNKVFPHKVTKEEIESNAEISEEHMRKGPSW